MKLRDENFNVHKFAFYDCFVVVVDDSMLFMFELLLFMSKYQSRKREKKREKKLTQTQKKIGNPIKDRKQMKM